MSDSFRKFQADFEIFANQQAAEIEAVRTVIQVLAVQISLAQPKPQVAFEALRDAVLKRLDNDARDPSNDQAATRKAEFVHLRAIQFFDEMAPIFGSKAPDSLQPRH